MDKEQFKKLIKETLDKMDGSGKGKYTSDDAVKLLYETARVESGNFKYIKQVKGPALGLFQLEPDTIWDIYRNFVEHRPALMCQISNLGFGKFAQKDINYYFKTNLALQIAFARLKYWRVPEPLPKHINGRAKYWKDWYNTALGKGTIDHYLELNGVKKTKKTKK